MSAAVCAAQALFSCGFAGHDPVCDEIREMDEQIPIAFTTTSTDHTLESYRLSVLKYLEKSVRQKDGNDLLRLVQMQKENIPRLVIQQNGKARKIPLSDYWPNEDAVREMLSAQKDMRIPLAPRLD